MAIEAPCSRYRKNNLKIYIAVLLAFTLWFGYDGYINKGFIEKHTDTNDKPDSTLMFNQKAPPFLLAGVLLIGIYFAKVKNTKIIADENELVLSKKEKISYDSIQKIDKTYFDKKGFFVLNYTDKTGKETDQKISERKYDNLKAVMEHLVTKIS
jgi:hypothetical protein